MKAEELMIGDWLYHVDDVDISNPQIVTGILSNGEIYVDGVISDISDYNPIPLTPEILEKNGFELLTDTWYFKPKERKPIHIRFVDEHIVVSINCSIIPMGLKHVHQLQHALRLCGISKEIVL